MSPKKPAKEQGDLRIVESDEPPDEAHWEPVDDTGEQDIALVVAAGAIQEDPWTPVDDTSKDDLDVQFQAASPPEQHWGPLSDKEPPLLAETAAPPPNLPLFSTPTPLPRWRSRARLTSPREVIPWRGTMRVPELLDLAVVYFAAPDQTKSQLLVAAWEWAEEEQPTGSRLLLRLTDDGPEIQVEALAAAEPMARLSGYLGKTSVEIHAALSVERDRRGLLLGRDVLAGNFLVDCSRQDEDGPKAEEAGPPDETA